VDPTPDPSGDPGGDARLGVEEVVETALGAMGYELVHLEWVGSGRHRILRVFLDHPGGVNLEACARMSPIVSNALDAAEVDPASPAPLRRLLEGAYTLEVSSPGLDRPLRRITHFQRFIARNATIRTTGPLDEGSRQKTFHGRIERVEPDPSAPHDDRRGRVELRSEDGTAVWIPLSRIRRANLVFEG
jgi:ribosome maturation factor RimP